MFEKLDQIKPALKDLVKELRKKYAYASVLAVEDDNRGWRISRTGKRINSQGFGGGSGYVVRVFDNIGCAEYSFNEFSEEKIPQIVKTIEERIAQEAKCIPQGIEPLHTPIPSDKPATLKKVSAFEVHPKELGDEKILARLDEIRNKALTVDGVLDAIATISYRAFRKIFISENRALDQTIMWTNGAIMAMAARGEEVKDAYKGFSTLGGAELLNRMDDYAIKVASEAVELLKSEPMIPGEYDCICDPDTTGMIVHEAFGHGVEMDMFVKDRALASSFIDQRVASDLVTMHDGNAVDDTATCWGDDEGTLTGHGRHLERHFETRHVRRTLCGKTRRRAHRQRQTRKLRAQSLHAYDKHLFRRRKGRRNSRRYDCVRQIRFLARISLQRYGRPEKLGYSMHGYARKRNQRRQTHGQSVLPHRAHGLRSRPSQIGEHDEFLPRNLRQRFLRKRLQRVG